MLDGIGVKGLLGFFTDAGRVCAAGGGVGSCTMLAGLSSGGLLARGAAGAAGAAAEVDADGVGIEFVWLRMGFAGVDGAMG